jgi:8-oxo-dGTP pyrophosphatase MutT (NUDIX family)
MPELGVVIAVLQDDTVLLTKREDFDVWCLPGGAVDPGEAVDQAAVREVLEETGLQVQLTHYVGLLNKPRWGRDGAHLLLFAARPTSRTFKANPAEVQDLAYFPVDHLPEPLLWEHRHLIKAAHSGATGHLWINRAQTPSRFANRTELYTWRDNSGLSRYAAYQQLMQEIGSQTLEFILGPQAGARITEAQE